MKKRVPIDAQFLYVVMTFLACLVSSNLCYALILKWTENRDIGVGAYILLLILLALSYTVLSIAFMFPFLYKRFPDLYHKCDDDKMWLKKAILLILPGELARYITCVLFYDRYFEKVTTEIYYAVYGMWMDASTIGVFDFLDDIVYTVIYVILAVPFIFAVLYMCKRFWATGKRLYEKEYGTVSE